MSAITIRNLPEETHAALRSLAALRGKSVESLVREVLGRAAQEGRMDSPPGMAEASAAFLSAEPSEAGFEALWGALQGTVQVAPGTDLTAPAGEAWQAESG